MKKLKFILSVLILCFAMAFQVYADDAYTQCNRECSNEYRQCVMEANYMSPSGARSIDGRECPLMAQACEDRCERLVAENQTSNCGEQGCFGGPGGNGTAGTAGGRQSTSDRNVQP